MKFFEDSCSRAREHVGIELAESHVPTQASANVLVEGSKHQDVNEEIIRSLNDLGLQIETVKKIS